MKLSKEQEDHYLQQDEEKFVGLVVEHLQEESPELIANLVDDSLREMIANGLKKARSYGINTDAQLIGFVSIMFEIAPNFDEQPDIHKILSSDKIPANDKFELIFGDAVSEEAWAEAENNYDEEAWFPELKEESQKQGS